MLDLRKKIPEIKKEILEGISSFEKENRGLKWSILALDSCPWMGFVALSVDTRLNSDSQVGEFESNGRNWYGEDKFGKFNDNCADFEFVEIRRLEIPEWEHEYNLATGSSLEYIDKAGNKKSLDLEAEGDRGYCRIIFELLKLILLEAITEIQAVTKNRDTICRVGIQIYDSDYKFFETI